MGGGEIFQLLATEGNSCLLPIASVSIADVLAISQLIEIISGQKRQ